MKKNALLIKIKNSWLFIIFFAVIILVCFVALIKIIRKQPIYIYTKVKVGQGLWWTATNKPSIWYVKGIKKGEIERDLTGKPLAEIVDVTYYPSRQENQYDTYLIVKIAVSGSQKTNKYSFKRSAIGVSSPIDFEFPSSPVTGTIIAISNQPFIDQSVEKIIYLTKKLAYPWEYDAIKVGDVYSNGQKQVLEIMDKTSSDTTIISSDLFGNSNASITDVRKYLVVKIRIKLKEVDRQLIYGEEQVINVGKIIYLTTENFAFSDFVIGKIE